MLLPPLNFGEHAVNDINGKSCPHWRKVVAPPLFLMLRGPLIFIGPLAVGRAPDIQKDH